MRLSKKIPAFLALSLILLIATSGCVQESPPETENVTVNRAGADSVDTIIRMEAGQLTVRGGADALLNATFTYNGSSSRPLVDYQIIDSVGQLSIRQPTPIPDVGGVQYAWDLELNSEVPMELDVDLGAGNAELYPGDLNLTDLRLRMGAGNALVDLTGDWNRDINASLSGGAGTMTVLIPRETGTRVEVEGLIGTINAPGLNVNESIYTNDAYGETPATLNVTIQSGVGTISLQEGER